jgi:hypothetical protein
MTYYSHEDETKLECLPPIFRPYDFFNRLTEDYYLSSQFFIVSQKTTCYRFAMQQQMFGGYIDGDGGVRASLKVPKLALANNQQGLETALEGSRGVVRIGSNDYR